MEEYWNAMLAQHNESVENFDSFWNTFKHDGVLEHPMDMEEKQPEFMNA